MEKLSSKTLMKIEQRIYKNQNLENFLSQKRNSNDITKNIINFDKIIPYFIADCLISFWADLQKDSYKYKDFIKLLYPNVTSKNRSDTKQRTNFNTFFQNINYFNSKQQTMEYVPPFIQDICDSIQEIPDSKRKQKYRNYTYSFVSAHTYSHIMCSSDSIPYFCHNQSFTQKNCQKFFEFLIDIKDYSAEERYSSQCYIDTYLNIHLFSLILNLYAHEKFYFLKESVHSKEDFDCYLDYFLFLCNLLQSSSGMFVKETLLHTIYSIFLSPNGTKRIQTFSNIELCYKQCAYELIQLNELVYPLVKKVFYDELYRTIGDTCCTSAIYSQLFTIITSNPSFTCLRKYLDDSITKLEKISKDIEYMEFPLFSHISQTFYNFIPFKINLEHLTPATELQIQYYISHHFDNIRFNHFKNHKFTETNFFENS